MTADIQVSGGGSVYLFTPLTEAGHAALTEQVASEPWQWLGRSLAVEHRFAGDLTAALQADGLVVV
jgi:hypothetical protein